MNWQCFHPLKEFTLFCRLATSRLYMIALIVPSMRTISPSHYRTCTPHVTCVAGHFMHCVSTNGLHNQESKNLPLPYHQESHPITRTCHLIAHPTLHLRCHQIHITDRHRMCHHHHVRDHVRPPIARGHLLLHMISVLRSHQ